MGESDLTAIISSGGIGADTLEVPRGAISAERILASEFGGQASDGSGAHPPSVQVQSAAHSEASVHLSDEHSVEDAVYQSIEPMSETGFGEPNSSESGPTEVTLKTERMSGGATEPSAESAQRQASVRLELPGGPHAAAQLDGLAIAPRSVVPQPLEGGPVGDFIGAVESMRTPSSFGAVLGASLDLELRD